MMTMRDAIDAIVAERHRQITHENWTPEHDDKHDGGELAMAAGCYAWHAGAPEPAQVRPGYAPQDWPWDAQWWKPKNRRRDLVRAAALIIAEIERLDRKAANSPRPDEEAEQSGADTATAEQIPSA